MASKTQNSTKKTGSKAASSKTVAAKDTVKEDVLIEEKEVKKANTYSDNDLILCRNISVGEVVFFGTKSGNTYRFMGQNDTYEIEVKDLNSLLASRSNILFKPVIVIEDDDFVSQTRWKSIKDMYDTVKAADILELIEKPIGEFKIILSNLPKGYRDLLVEEVSSRLQDGTFDSLAKIKAVDEICGTELILLAN